MSFYSFSTSSLALVLISVTAALIIYGYRFFKLRGKGKKVILIEILVFLMWLSISLLAGAFITYGFAGKTPNHVSSQMPESTGVSLKFKDY